MAVIHHAFRFRFTPESERDVAEILTQFAAGNKYRLSMAALEHYETLADREDLAEAFHFGREGVVSAWLEPDVISPSLAAFVRMAKDFVPAPSLSKTHDTNHRLLMEQLPSLRWSQEEVASLVRGQPVELVLQALDPAASFAPGGFRETGGWVSPEIRKSLRETVNWQVQGLLPSDTAEAILAWERLDAADALRDAQNMLSGPDDGWLVLSTTH